MSIPNIGLILSSGIQIGGDATETAVAHAWLTAHVNDFDRVAFPVKLGPGVDIGPGYPDYIQRMAKANSQARADLIAYKGPYATIVEFKGNITPHALGQVLVYRDLLKAQNPQLIQIYMTVAGVTVQHGLTANFGNYGVTVETYPGAVPPDSTTS
jgi:hypothetical protein